MNKFKIFTEVDKFYFTNNVIHYSITLFGILLCSLFKEFNFPIGVKIFSTIVILNLIYSLYLVLSATSRYEPLKGKIENTIDFEEDRIVIANKPFLLNNIKKIEILCYDVKDQWNIIVSRGNFNGQISNGVGNSLKLLLIDGTSQEIYFQQDNSTQIINIENLLISYYKKDKLEFRNLTKILGYEDSDAIESFRKTITAANSTHASLRDLN